MLTTPLARYRLFLPDEDRITSEMFGCEWSDRVQLDTGLNLFFYLQAWLYSSDGRAPACGGKGCGFNPGCGYACFILLWVCLLLMCWVLMCWVLMCLVLMCQHVRWFAHVLPDKLTRLCGHIRNIAQLVDSRVSSKSVIWLRATLCSSIIIKN